MGDITHTLLFSHATRMVYSSKTTQKPGEFSEILVLKPYLGKHMLLLVVMLTTEFRPVIFMKVLLLRKGMHGKSIESRILEEAEMFCETIRKKQGRPFIIEVIQCYVNYS